MINVINYAIELSKIKDKKFINSLIGKIQFVKFQENNEKLVYDAKEKKSNKNISIIEINASSNNIVKEKMIVTIVLDSFGELSAANKQILTNKDDLNYNFQKVFLKKFTKNEIAEFSNIVRDYNPIHLDSKKSIVQGMNILNEIVKRYHISSSFVIKFLNPVYDMQDIYIETCKRTEVVLLKGISAKNICFKMKLGE